MPKNGLPKVFDGFRCMGEAVDRRRATWRLVTGRLVAHGPQNTKRGAWTGGTAHVAAREWVAHRVRCTEARGSDSSRVRDSGTRRRCSPHVGTVRATWHSPIGGCRIPVDHHRDTWLLPGGLLRAFPVLGTWGDFWDLFVWFLALYSIRGGKSSEFHDT